jgi:hypothetical protein
MIKNYLILAFLIALNINTLFSQSFEIPGEVLVNGEFEKGFFSNVLNEYTNELSFQFTNSKNIINLNEVENVVFKVASNNLTYKTLKSYVIIKPYIMIIDGKASFFSDITSKHFFVQNTSKDSKLIKLADFRKTKNNARNLGLLSVIYEDCIEVRSQLRKQSITKTVVIKLTNDYNSCVSYTNGYELTSQQKTNQTYETRKTIYSLDIGGGLSFKDYESVINGFEDSSATSDNNNNNNNNNNGYNVFVSLNVSPSYFKSLYGKLYFDVALSYNTTPSFETQFYDVSRNSISLNVSPTFYFRDQKRTKPFVRVNFGLDYSSYDLKSNRSGIFGDLAGTRSNLFIGFEAGVQIFNTFELAILIQPSVKENYPVSINALRLDVDTRTIALKASYIINFSKSD